MVAGANVLPITCATVEQIDLPTFTNTILASVTNWFATNQTKRPQYIVLFPDIPSRVWTSTNLGGIAVESVAYGLNTGVPGIKPLVTSINMGLLDTTNDCTNYINKVAAFGATNAGGIEISASAGGTMIQTMSWTMWCETAPAWASMAGPSRTRFSRMEPPPALSTTLRDSSHAQDMLQTPTLVAASSGQYFLTSHPPQTSLRTSPGDGTAHLATPMQLTECPAGLEIEAGGLLKP